MGRHLGGRSGGGHGQSGGGHGRRDNGFVWNNGGSGGSHGNDGGYGRGGGPGVVAGLAGLATRMTWGVAVVGLVVLTVAAAFGFLLVDPALNLLAGLMGVAMSNGKEAASLFGVGELAGLAIDGAKATDLPAQVLALLSAVLKPLIVVGWLLGVVVLLALPVIASKLAATARRYRG